MAHSFAEYPSLTCPECGAAFSPEIWLIVDAAERPELIDRVRDDTIHDVVCPRGHVATLDSPLLLFRPDGAPRLIFSPAENTTTEEDREMVNGLAAMLAESMGGDWRDEWLTEGRVVVREDLPALLDDTRETEGWSSPSPDSLEQSAPLIEDTGEDNEALLAAIVEFVNVPSWWDSYFYLMDHMGLLTEVADGLFEKLAEEAAAAGKPDNARLFNEHRDLLQRSRVIGAEAFAEKMGITGQQFWTEKGVRELLYTMPSAARKELLDVGAELLAGGLSSPEEALQAMAEQPELQARYEAALRDAFGDGDEDDNWWADLMDEASADDDDHPVTFVNSSEQSDGAAADAEGSRVMSEEEFGVVLGQMMELMPSGVFTPPAYVGHVRRAEEARERYEAGEDWTVLVEAVTAWEQILNDPHFDSQPLVFLLQALNNAGGAFQRLYNESGNPLHLARTIDLWQKLINRAPRSMPQRVGYLSNLGIALMSRYQRDNRLDDLETAISYCREATETSALDYPFRAGAYNNLGAGLGYLYGRIGSLEVLEASIEANEIAAADTSAAPPQRALYLDGLATGLRDRYMRTRDVRDLERSIDLIREAIKLVPDNSPNQALYHDHLGSCVRSLYEWMDEFQVLETAISAHQFAVDHTSDDSPAMMGYQNNLGNALHDRYARTHEKDDLVGALASWKAAIERAPADSPHLAMYFSNYGNGLANLYTLTDEPKHLDDAIEAYEKAVVQIARTAPDFPDRAGYLYNLATSLSDRHRLTPGPADLAAAIAVFEDAIAALDQALLDSPVAYLLGQQSRWVNLYDRAVTALLAAGRTADALAVAEGSKSRLLANLMGRGELPRCV